MTKDPESAGAAGRGGNVRVSSAEREQAIEVIKSAFADGRLSMDEHLERVGRAITCRTSAELAALSADLPSGPSRTIPSPAVVSPADHIVMAGSPRANPLAVAAIACGLIPLLPATLAAIVLGIRAHCQIKQTGERGEALATAGLALAAFWIVLTVIALLVFR